MSEFISFEELEVWKRSRELRQALEKLVKSFPAAEKYRLNDQIIRAARSVTNNIAEGYGRYHYAESIKFYLNSRGSLYEIIDHLIISIDNKYLTEEDFLKFRSECIGCVKMLNGYIRYTKNQKLLNEKTAK